MFDQPKPETRSYEPTRVSAAAEPAAPRSWRLLRIARFQGRPGEVHTEPGAAHTSIRYIEDGHGTAWLNGAVRTLAPGDACILHRDTPCQIFNDAQHPIRGVTIDCSGPMIDQLMAAYGLLDQSHISQSAIGLVIRNLLPLAIESEATQRRAGLLLHEMLAQLGDKANHQPEWPEVVRRSKAYIDDNVDLPLRLADVARHARCSEAHLSRMFRRCLGVPPGDYSLRQRMALAKRLLHSTGDSIKCIALRLGYRDSFAFSHAFKNIEGTAPALWRSADRRAKDLARAS